MKPAAMWAFVFLYTMRTNILNVYEISSNLLLWRQVGTGGKLRHFASSDVCQVIGLG